MTRLTDLLDRLPRWLDLAALGLVVLIIFFGSSIPPAEFPDLSLFSYDKVLHMLEYLGLGGALWMAGRRRWLPRLERRWASPWLAAMLGIVLPGALWAVSDEVHQYLVGRDCDVWDWLADLAGLLLAVVLVRWLRRGEAAGQP